MLVTPRASQSFQCRPVSILSYSLWGIVPTAAGSHCIVACLSHVLIPDLLYQIEQGQAKQTFHLGYRRKDRIRILACIPMRTPHQSTGFEIAEVGYSSKGKPDYSTTIKLFFYSIFSAFMFLCFPIDRKSHWVSFSYQTPLSPLMLLYELYRSSSLTETL